MAVPDSDSITPRLAARAEYGFILIGMLLFSERTWKHHCVTLVLPFAVLCYHLATQPAGRWPRWGLIGTLAAAALLMLSTSTGVFGDDTVRAGDVSDLFGKQMEVYGAYLWAFLLLGGALMVLVRRPADATGQLKEKREGVITMPTSRVA